MPDGGIPLGTRITSKRWDVNDLRARITAAMDATPRDDGAVDKLLDDLEKASAELRSLETKEGEARARARPAFGDPAAPAIAREGGRPEVKPEHLIRSGLVYLESRLMSRRVGDVLAARFGDDALLADVVHVTAVPHMKAAQPPATTFTPTYAAELVREVWAAWTTLLKDSGAVAAVPWNYASFDEGSPAHFPMRNPAAAFPANFEAAFRKEGDSIRVGVLSVISAAVKPYSAGVIGTFTKELFKRSTPNIEDVIREAIVDDTNAMLDAVVFGSGAAVADVRPAGLTNGLAAANTRASSGATLEAIEADLNQMILGMMNARVGARPTWIMHKANVLYLDSVMTSLGIFPYRAELRAGRLKTFPVVSSVHVKLGEILLVDAANVAFAGGTPAWEVSDQATIHEETETPLPVGGAATPVRSLFQTHSAAIKAVYELSWLPLRAGAVQQLTSVDWLPGPAP